MNYNILTYFIFVLTISFITLRVGWIFYNNGEVYLNMLFVNDQHLVPAINKLLLVGYYLLNIGYALVVINWWEDISSLSQCLSVLANKAGLIITFLALMHYFNLFWLLMLSKWKNSEENKFQIIT